MTDRVGRREFCVRTEFYILPLFFFYFLESLLSNFLKISLQRELSKFDVPESQAELFKFDRLDLLIFRLAIKLNH